MPKKSHFAIIATQNCFQNTKNKPEFHLVCWVMFVMVFTVSIANFGFLKKTSWPFVMEEVQLPQG